MIKNITVDNFPCVCSLPDNLNDLPIRVVYMIYPEVAEFHDKWIQQQADKFRVAFVTIYVPGDKWDDILTPWTAPGVPKGCPPFTGKAAEFLDKLKNDILPRAEAAMQLQPTERNLVGVSLSGLFTLWTWMQDDTFRSIGCMSGSYWYPGFLDWFNAQPIPAKSGKAFFLLGVEEPHTNVKGFQSVGINTEAIVNRLKTNGIDTAFEWVPGNHFSAPVRRAELTLTSLLG